MRKRKRADFPHAGRKDDLLETAFVEAIDFNLFEPVWQLDVFKTRGVLKRAYANALKSLWELDSRKAIATFKRIFPDYIQLTPSLEHDFSQVLAFFEGAFRNLLDALRDGYSFDSSVAKASEPYRF